jgi:phosphatidylglycerophosphatase A
MAKGSRQLMFVFFTKKKPYPIQLELTLEQDQQTIFLDDF